MPSNLSYELCQANKGSGVNLYNGRKFAVYGFLAAKMSADLSFRKFSKPCNHQYYMRGQSWGEYLKVNEHCFRKLRKIMCPHYTSMKAFKNEKDPFQGKPFASYHHKLIKATFYVLNPIYQNYDLLDFLRALGLPGKKYSVESKRYNKIIFPLYPPKGEKRVKNLKNDEKFKEKQKKAKSMIRVWKQVIPDSSYLTRKPSTICYIADKLDHVFEGSLEKWQMYCEKIKDLNNWYEKRKLKFHVNIKGALSEHYLNLKLFGIKPVREKTKIKHAVAAAPMYNIMDLPEAMSDRMENSLKWMEA